MPVADSLRGVTRLSAGVRIAPPCARIVETIRLQGIAVLRMDTGWVACPRGSEHVAAAAGALASRPPHPSGTSCSTFGSEL